MLDRFLRDELLDTAPATRTIPSSDTDRVRFLLEPLDVLDFPEPVVLIDAFDCCLTLCDLPCANISLRDPTDRSDPCLEVFNPNVRLELDFCIGFTGFEFDNFKDLLESCRPEEIEGPVESRARLS